MPRLCRLIDPAAPGGRYVGLVNFGGYTPGTIPGGASTTSTTSPWVSTNSDPAWVSLYKTSGATPSQVVDENLVDTQGDSGGQTEWSTGCTCTTSRSATFQTRLLPTRSGSRSTAMVRAPWEWCSSAPSRHKATPPGGARGALPCPLAQKMNEAKDTLVAMPLVMANAPP